MDTYHIDSSNEIEFDNYTQPQALFYTTQVTQSEQQQELTKDKRGYNPVMIDQRLKLIQLVEE